MPQSGFVRPSTCLTEASSSFSHSSSLAAASVVVLRRCVGASPGVSIRQRRANAGHQHVGGVCPRRGCFQDQLEALRAEDVGMRRAVWAGTAPFHPVGSADASEGRTSSSRVAEASRTSREVLKVDPAGVQKSSTKFAFATSVAVHAATSCRRA